MAKKKHKEIEIKLTYKNKAGIIERLKPEIILMKKISVHDIYFSRKHSMANKNDLIRIRKIADGATELTFKGKAKDRSNVWHRTELTTEVQSAETTARILTALGFEKFAKYKNSREYWQYKGMEIAFCHFTEPVELKFMEIEGTSCKKIKATVNKLGRLANEAGEEIFSVFDKKRKS